MSFAGRAGKRGRGLGVVPGGSPATGEDPLAPASPMQAAGREEPSWMRGALFGAGIAVGAMVGAGLALLYAPQSGLQTRTAIRRRSRKLVSRGHDAWDELADELRRTARRRTKQLRRRGTKARWAAEDWRDERDW